MIGVLLVDLILALTDGILLVFALRYFKAEQADGTPFTQRGAELEPQKQEEGSHYK